MNKLFAILLSAALLLPVLAGCQSSETQQPPVTTLPQAESTAPTQQETVPATEPAAQYITPEEAKAIALQDAGLAEADVRDLEVELDRDGGKVHYDVDFEKGNADYDYDIDAVTGEILRVEKPVPQAATTPAPSPTSQLTVQEAQAIALKHAGFQSSEVRGLEVELDRDDGPVHYDVDFEKDGYDYDYEIDAYSGKILKSHKERD